jgi:hypothetical protein
MNSAVLVAALVAPLLGALAALLVPTGRERRSRSGRRPSRRKTKAAAASGTQDDIAVDDTVGGAPLPETTAASEIDRSEPPSAADADAVERAGRTSRTLVRVAAMVTAALWVAISLLGPSTAGPAQALGAVAPAAAGGALLLAAAPRPRRRLPAAGAALALALAAGGLALGVGDGGPGLAVAGLAAAAVITALTGRRGDDGNLGPAALALAGTAAMAGGLIRVAARTGDFTLPADAPLGLDAGVLLVGGSAAVAVAAALRPRSATGVLLPFALALGVPAAALMGDAGDGVALVLMLLAAGAGAAWALGPRSPWGDLRPLVAALALAALAAAAVATAGVPGSGAAVAGTRAAGLPAAWLLAAAAVITAVTLVPLAALSALPGAAAMVVLLVADPEPLHLMVVALIAATTVAGAVAVRRNPPPQDGGAASSEPGAVVDPLLVAVPTLVMGLWLLLAPQSWSWAGTPELEGWTETVALALAGGLIAAVAGGATGRVALPRLPRLTAPDPVQGVENARAGARLALVAGVGLGLALIALLASSTGAS